MLMALANTTAGMPTTADPDGTSTSPAGPEFLRLHPAELSALLESFWAARIGRPTAVPAFAVHSALYNQLVAHAAAAARYPQGPAWHHLMYAYMMENTRIYEIFRRVLDEYLHGEKLGVPLVGAEDWIRSTEALWYSEVNPFSVGTVRSEVRPDSRAVRRNAYQRMFGMDLNHGTDDNQPYRYARSETANNEFVSAFEELLREVWVGISNVGNTGGAVPTDDAKIAMLADNLRNMLRSRRLGGNLLREEYVAVSMMSWLHLAVSFNSPIVRSLRAEAESPAERLYKIASKVGLPAHGLSNSYFQIAAPISNVLTLLETVAFAAPGAARAFYDPSVPGVPPGGQSLPDAMNGIITHWSMITGRDMKARKVSTT
jgi:hypothetical protein